MFICTYNEKGLAILRGNMSNHTRNECTETMMDCTNEDCKIQVARKDLDNHVNNICNVRIVSCPFGKYGCHVKKIKFNELEGHKEDYKFEHISLQFQHVTNELSDKISGLQQENEQVLMCNLFMFFDL